MNGHLSPREDTAREYLWSLQRRDAQQDRAQYAEKGRDTLLDGYTEEEFERICIELWLHGAESSPECQFRTLVQLFGFRPSALFLGVNVRLTTLINPILIWSI